MHTLNLGLAHSHPALWQGKATTIVLQKIDTPYLVSDQDYSRKENNTSRT
ncbi:MAG: hypothetical protein HQ500_09360 [Flavobacteriales bacterium]|nr:hypothetical protein [Flavobacteriales bacterium]